MKIKTAYEQYLESDNKTVFISNKALEWNLTEDEVTTLLLNTHSIKRAESYPSIEEQLDALWHGMSNDETKRIEPFYSLIKTIKDNLPKSFI